MILVEKIFQNYFEAKAITSVRLLVFTNDAIAKLEAANEPLLNDFVPRLKTLVQALSIEIGQVKSGMAMQKGKTLVLNDFIKSFKDYMSLNHHVIAKMVGGFDTEAYLTFYPQGATEYRIATQAKLPALLMQVANAAEKYASVLGEPMTQELKHFNVFYQNQKNDQLLQKGNIAENRVERSNNRKALEVELIRLLHWLGYHYPLDVNKVASFFSFSLLEKRHKAAEKPGGATA